MTTKTIKSFSENLLTPEDPDAVSVYKADRLQQSSILLVCDHASDKVPRKLNNLGLDQSVFSDHIAVDVGTHDMSCYLADKLNAPAVLAGFSRLVVDLNRAPLGDRSIPASSFGTDVPANKDLSTEQRDVRLNELYYPYHQKISECLEATKSHHKKPIVLLIHSFAPFVEGEEKQRPDISILWDGNREISTRMINTLRTQNPDLNIGDNDPYSLEEAPHLNHTVIKHDLNGTEDSILVEFRQDLIGNDAGVKKFGDIFLKALMAVMVDKIS